MPAHGLDRLNPAERRAVVEFARLLERRFGNLISSVALFGSKARGESTPDSDLDVLVVVDSEDWRIHKQIRYLAADIGLKYDVDLSPRVWSGAHYTEMQHLRSLLYQIIRRDSINLLETDHVLG